MKTLVAVLAVLAGYVVGRRHGRRWECRDRLVDAIEEAVETGVVEVLPPAHVRGVYGDCAGLCSRCGRQFTTNAAVARHRQLIEQGIRCDLNGVS
jgi:hypothetical protein